MQPRLLPYFPASGLLTRLKHIDEATGQIQCTFSRLFSRKPGKTEIDTTDVSYCMIYNSIKNNKPHLNIDAACLISQMSFRYT